MKKYVLQKGNKKNDKMKDMKISRKLSGSFIFLIIVIVVTGVCGIWGMSKISAADQSLYDQQAKPLAYVSGMMQSIECIRLDIRAMAIFSDDPQKIKELKADIETYDASFRENQKNYMNTLKIQEGLDIIQGVYDTYDGTFYPSVTEVVQRIENGQVEEATASVKAESKDVTGMTDQLNQVFKNSNRDALSKSENNYKMFVDLSAVLVIILVVGAILAVFVCIRITKSIIRPIREIVDVSNQFAEGKLNTELTYCATNEMGQMSDSLRTVFSGLRRIVKEVSETLVNISQGNVDLEELSPYKGDFLPLSEATNEIVKQLNAIFTSIQLSAEQVSSGASQVADGAQALSQSTTEQASSTEELSATISDVSEKVEENSVRVSEMYQEVNETVGFVTDSNNQMKQLLGAMNEIDKSSDEIAKIIKVIDNIAFQTNILALNAAVEAARAGEAGKGFAVVADEVRNLAGKSADAAKQTSTLIETSLSNISAGSALTNRTAGALEKVTTKMNTLHETIQKVETASNQQASALADVTIGIGQIAQIVESNSATAEESAAASEELSAQAEALDKQVSKFSLRS